MPRKNKALKGITKLKPEDMHLYMSPENKMKYKKPYMLGYMKGCDTRDGYYKWLKTFVGAWMMENCNATNLIYRLHAILGHVPTWNDITDETLIILMGELQSSCNKDFEKVTAPTILYYTSRIKAFLNKRADTGLFPSKNYKSILVSKKTVSQSVYMTSNEIKAFSLTPTRTDAEKYVKTLFLIACYTGARSVDLPYLTMANCETVERIDENGRLVRDETLVYISRKTRNEVRQILHPKALELIKYKCSMEFKVITDKYGKMDKCQFIENVRNICQRAGINEHTELFAKGRNLEGPKYKFIATHTARRSFATNLYLAGSSVDDIREWMGHADAEMTMKYIKATKPITDSVKQKFYNAF